MATTALLTAEDLWNMGSDADGYELIRGVLHRMAPAFRKHGEVAGDFHTRLGGYALANGFGLVYSSDTGFILERDPSTVLAPDVAYVRADRLPPDVEDTGFVDVVPDLVFEVRSPSNSAPEIATKVEIYLAAGVPVVLIAEPRRRVVTVHRPGQPAVELGDTEALDLDDAVAGFRLPIAAVFDRPPMRVGSS